ncbi:hypothetical protein HXA34_20540 [Salipaludibacillus agaradhaerens]|jgi:hypothetical protein|uniref:hypothetical protein n=1 Tax=Salipaludibacillus agaradhaerens TaxID=76935 RepID=UPI002151A46A|nr:hypothetical protein [Salipaludibacillus agaradhaerens]MCR6108688.1 hypothetical protein [Salipaludibacillus agaradhaerens]MCR6120711.1 hypothetical protein [Salipaludibacillus agaradhaerens]
MQTAKKEETLIQPFKSMISKKSVVRGFRVTNGKYSKRLDNMGYSSWEEVTESDKSRYIFENLLKWDVAHKNYHMLKLCISICDEYDEERGTLDYKVDIYGDKSAVKHGSLYIGHADYLMLYMRMDPYRRKESLVSRIALANSGMLVPYVRLNDVMFDDTSNHVKADYRIVL